MSISPMSASQQLKDLQRAAMRLARRARAPEALPALLVLTDPVRTPDPLALAERLPSGAALVYRHFGSAEAAATAAGLVRAARRRGLVLLIGADPELAFACGAAGVHLPERMLGCARRLRARWPGALVTAAAHGGGALQAVRRAGVDAAVLSPVFPSRSPSAGAPLGPLRTAILVRAAGLPVYALGGVEGRTARRLAGTGVSGAAAVGAAAASLRRP